MEENERSRIIVIRTDSSDNIGSGHLMRCLTLAESLKERGVVVHFICRLLPGNLAHLVEEKGFSLHALQFHNGDASPPPYHAPWLQTTWEEDAQECQCLLSSINGVDWLLVDHYALDRRWESAMRPFVNKIMSIDDLADRPHDCDLLLDQNLIRDMNGRYKDLVSPQCLQLIGPRYALLQKEYSQLHESVRIREGRVRRLLISFGGTDKDDLTGMTVRALKRLSVRDLTIDVVSNRYEPETGFHQTVSFNHYHRLPSLAPLMKEADLAIGAAGTTSWERLCLGLPSVLITMAKNQEAVAAGLQSGGLAIWLGSAKEVGELELVEGLRSIIEKGIDGSMSRRCLDTVDGLGTKRCLEVICPDKNRPIIVRNVLPDDEFMLLSWANDPVTRGNSFQKALIQDDDHRRWFHTRLNDHEQCRFFIAESSSGIPLGQVRFEKRNDSWQLNYSLSSPFRGQGLAGRMLEGAIHKLEREFSSPTIVACVLKGNVQSKRALSRLGFTTVGEDDESWTMRRL